MSTVPAHSTQHPVMLMFLSKPSPPGTLGISTWAIVRYLGLLLFSADISYIIVYLHNLVKKYYNGIMITIHRCALLCALILVLLGSAGCASVPRIENPQFTQRHYTYSVLLAPLSPGNSPQLELALSLLRMEYPEKQAEAFHNILYGQPGLDAYKDFILGEQRKNYRDRAGDLPTGGGGTASFNWRYAEKYNIKQIYERGIIIERDLETFSGSASSGKNTKYYNIEIDAHGYRQVTFEDLFDDYQDDQRLRDIVYNELRQYGKLNSGQPLSQGIYFSNQPELTFNFIITENGLILHWDPAQIAPRSEGSIQIILPWDIVRPLMLYTGVEMLAKFNIDLDLGLNLNLNMNNEE